MTKRKIEQWQVKDSVLVLDNRWARVRRDTCILPDGTETDDYYYWEGGDFAQVFAQTQEGEVILVKQYKHGVKEIVLELPAGMIEEGENNPLTTAQRELMEETGFQASEWQSFGILNVSSAKSSTQVYPFLARNARLVSQPQLDDQEAIEVILCPVHEMLNLIAKGEIRESNSLATCLLALKALGLIIHQCD